MSTCRTCGGVPDCDNDAIDYYSLQDDTYFQVSFECPEGALCVANSLSLVCCDGQIVSVSFPSSATEEQRSALMNGLLREFYSRQAFCASVPDTFYYNAEQTCVLGCPGSLTSWRVTVSAGSFAAATQAEADLAAYQYACTLAQASRLCFSMRAADPSCCCKGSSLSKSYYVDIAVGSLSSNLNYTLSGSIPPGMVFEGGYRTDRKCVVRGTPTTAGTYNFRITASIGINSAYRDYSICVNEITSTPAGDTSDKLPDGTEGAAYNVQLNASDCIAEVTKWEITSGTLPAGLSLDEDTGIISGTPTEDGDFSITIRMTGDCT